MTSPDRRSATYRDELARELAAVGIGGGLRRRILAEVADHLECDPDATLGSPDALARQFADELGTARTRRAVWTAFAALALAGLLVLAAFLTSGPVGLFAQHGRFPITTVTYVGAVLLVVGGQVAFAAGMLALLGSWSRGRGRLLTHSEALILQRRTGVAIACALISLVGLALLGLGRPHLGSHAWVIFTVAGAGVGAAGLLASVPALVAALRVQPAASGETGDVIEDLGPLAPPVLQGHPWWFALLVTGGVGLGVALLGAAASDPYDGILRGLLESAMCLGGFILLGPFLGLWSRHPAATTTT
ncbi:MAG TPA: hypothetical protein VE983_03405 [Solirubrobacteraceae bacterium]|nr:hypothetical protein [Solirubrobacteraceae bacterium]